MIRFEHLSKTFQTKDGAFEALKDVSFEIEKGDIYGVIGYNGAGKSTLIRMVNALERPTSGKIFVEDKDIGSLSAKELRSLRKGIGMIFQQFNLLESKTIYDNVAIALKLNGTPKKDIETRVNELLEFVELSDKKSYYPGQLSGGQKQRVGIARALANNPSILLCDEATSALDPKTTDSILDLLKKINETLHITIVIITHEMNVIQKICNKVAVMDFGKVVETGSVIQVFSDPQSDIAKRFVGNLIHDVIPEPLVESIRRETRNSRLLRIKLENTDSTEPLLWDINRRFEVETNILYSTINVIQGIVVGIMLVLFIGSDEEIKKPSATFSNQTKNIRRLYYHDSAVFRHFSGQTHQGRLGNPVYGRFFPDYRFHRRIFIAIVLWLTRKGGLKENPLLYTILNGFINIIRSTPFIILLVCVMPFTKIIVGTRIGTRAAIVPLVIYTAPFLARLLETSLLEVGGGIIEAAQSMGATTFQIIVHFVLPEAFASVILALTTGTIALIGATAMAGYIGGGGIGNIALTYGYQTFNFPLMFATVFILIAFVWIIQSLGNRLSQKRRTHQ